MKSYLTTIAMLHGYQQKFNSLTEEQTNFGPAPAAKFVEHEVNQGVQFMQLIDEYVERNVSGMDTVSNMLEKYVQTVVIEIVAEIEKLSGETKFSQIPNLRRSQIEKVRENCLNKANYCRLERCMMWFEIFSPARNIHHGDKSLSKNCQKLIQVLQSPSFENWIDERLTQIMPFDENLHEILVKQFLDLFP